MSHKERKIDLGKHGRKSRPSSPSPLPTLIWLVVGVFAFVALVMAFIGR